MLPLPDESVDAVWSATLANAAAVLEFLRVLRPGGRLLLAGSAASALNSGERMLSEAGFVDVTVVSDDRGPSLDARKP